MEIKIVSRAFTSTEDESSNQPTAVSKVTFLGRVTDAQTDCYKRSNYHPSDEEMETIL